MRKKSQRHFSLKQHWKKQWKINTEAMKANLDSLIAARKALKERKAESVSQVIKRLPRAFEAAKSKQLMADALTAQGLDPSKARLKRLRVYAVRYGYLTYDRQWKLWTNCLID
jgi:ABC-type nitrate/sulfonate/bicarbonate transport system substrate-binding protein